MDPDANLRELLNLARTRVQGVDDTEVCRMAELVLALDDWIRGGGFLPRSWRNARMGAP
jgi:hypothetical protein